ncbi:unnamed protein product, partial [Porites lobata]
MVTFFVVFTAFLAVLVTAILRMYFNQLVPEGLPVDQHHKLRTVGVITKLTGMVAYLASLLGIGSVINNIRQIQSFLSHLQNVPEDPSLQIKDLKIADVPVRLYRSKQNIVDGKKQTCVVFFHGGGWMFLSIDFYHSLTQYMAANAGVNRKLAGQILISPLLQFMDLTLPSYQKNSSAVLSKIEVALAWSFYITGTKRMSRPIGANKHSAHLYNTKYSKFIGVCDADVDKVQKEP